MNRSSLQNEILNLEKQYWVAMTKNDVEAAVSLTKFPCVVTGPMGAKKVTEKEYRQMMTANNPDKYKGVEIKDPQVELLSDDTALISYSTKVGGMNMLDVSTWIREGRQWRCAFHSENPQSK